MWLLNSLPLRTLIKYCRYKSVKKLNGLINIMQRLVFFICFIFLCGSSSAEVYKWVDENGKLQFSDKAPPEKQAENIEKQLQKINVDEASKTLGSGVVPRADKTADEEILDIKKRQNMEEKIGKKCRKLQEEINSIARGDLVVFFDKDGKEEKVLERDRGKKLEEWKAGYKRSDCEKLYPLG